MRYWLILLLSFVAFFGAITATYGSIQARNEALRGYVDATRDSNLPFRIPRSGINAELAQYDANTLDQQLDMMVQANFHWIRQTFPWQVIEPDRGRYDWSQWDTIINAVSNRSDLRLIAVLNTSPDWSRATGNSNTAPPDDPMAFAAFAGQFARRYADQIDHYQIWDEPNLAVGWGENTPNPTEYAALLAASYDAIHNNDPQATVISAGLAPTLEQTNLTIPETDFLQALYRMGASEFLDAVAGKPYGFDSSPSEAIHPTRLNFRRIVLLREIMIANGDGHKALWATQWGWNHLPHGWSGPPSVWGQVSQDQQIQYTLSALELAERQWPWLGGMILEAWQPDTRPEDPFQGFALLTPDTTTGSLYNALVQRSSIQAATNGLFNTRTTYANYSGVWTFGQLGADIGWINDSTAEFIFAGSDVAVLVRQDDYIAYLYAAIDQQSTNANALPMDSNGNAYLVLTSGDLQPETRLVSIANGLENATHKLTLIADELIPDESLNRWPLVGYAVSSGNLETPYNRQITVAWLAVIISGGTVTISLLQIKRKLAGKHIMSLLDLITDTGRILLGILSSLALMIGMLFTWGDSIPELVRREPINIAASMLTAGIIYVQPGLLLTIIAVLFLFVLIFNRLTTGLFLIIFWSPFFLFPIELYTFAFPIVEILLWITVTAWILHVLAALKHPQSSSLPIEKPTLTSIDAFVLTYMVLGVLSLIWTQRLDPALTELRVLVIQPALFYLILRTTKLERTQLLLLVDGLILAGTLVAFIGIIQYVRGEAIITAEDGVRRLASVYGSPNNVGLLIGRTLPFVVTYILIGIDTKRRIISGIAFCVLAPAALLTQSAGALFIGIPAGIAVALLFVYQRRAIIPIATLGVTTIILFGFAYQASPRFERALDMTQGTNFYRLRVWESALNIISDYPIRGLGLDQFLYAFRDKYILPDAWEEPDLSHPHNFILDIWIRLGFAGLVAFMAVMVIFWRNNLQLIQSLSKKARQNRILLAIIIGMCGSMASLLAHGMVDNSIFVLDLAYIFMFLLGLNVIIRNVSAIDLPN